MWRDSINIKSLIQRPDIQLGIYNDDIIYLQIEQIISHTSFNKMKSNPATNLQNIKYVNQTNVTFQRSGKVGDWTNWFSEEQQQYMDQVISERLANTGLSFED